MKLNLNDDALSRLEIIDPVYLNQAIESVKSDGYVVLDDVVSFESLDILSGILLVCITLFNIALHYIACHFQK